MPSSSSSPQDYRPIQSAVIIGGGALGLMYAQAMQAVLGDRLCFVAEGERLERLRRTVYTINGQPATFAARPPADFATPDAEKPDLVLVAVKNYDLPAVLPLLTTICGPETVIVSVLNGIDSEALIEAAVPQATVLYCCVQAMDAGKSGDSLVFTSRGYFLIGTRNRQPSPALERVLAFLQACRLEARVPDDIHKSLWSKWMLNVGVNQVSALAGAKFGEFRHDANLRSLMRDAMAEVAALARACGIALGDAEIDAWFPVIEGLGAEGKTSMLQDVEAGRRTELESFGGKVLRLSAEHGLSAPVNATLYRLLKIRERLGAPGTV